MSFDLNTFEPFNSPKHSKHYKTNDECGDLCSRCGYPMGKHSSVNMNCPSDERMKADYPHIKKEL